VTSIAGDPGKLKINVIFPDYSVPRKSSLRNRRGCHHSLTVFRQLTTRALYFPASEVTSQLSRIQCAENGWQRATGEAFVRSFD